MPLIESLAVTGGVVASALVFGAILGFIARRALATPVGWLRSLAVGAIVLLVSVPVATWVADESGVVVGTSMAVDLPIASLFAALGVGWMIAAGTGILVAFEAAWPTGTVPNPIQAIRDGARARRRARRYVQIVRIMSTRGVGRLLRTTRSAGGDERSAAALVGAMNDAGVTFIKLGQMLATRRDVLPGAYVRALGTLQTRAEPERPGTIRHIVEEALGLPLDAVFVEFEDEPMAAASVAQVHRATLIDGSRVAVKVQRPAARETVVVDSDILARLARTAEHRAKWARDASLAKLVDGFVASLHDELDYRKEAANLGIMASSLEGRDDIVVPRVHRQLTGERILVMSLVDGEPVAAGPHALSALRPERRKELARTLLRAVLDGVLVNGVFHADLHQGNILLTADGRLGLIDFGNIGILDAETRHLLATLLFAVSIDDNVAAVDALLLAVDAPEDVDVPALRREIGEVITAIRFHPNADMTLFSRLFGVLRVHGLGLPHQVASALRTLGSLEGTLTRLDPDFGIIPESQAHARTVMRDLAAPKRLAAAAAAQASVGMASARRMPERLERMTSALADGRFTIKTRVFSQGSDRAWVRHLVDDAVAALIAVASLVAAVVLVTSDAGPFITETVRLTAFVGYVIGLFSALLTLRSVIRLFTRTRATRADEADA